MIHHASCAGLHDTAECIHAHLPQHPELAFSALSRLTCYETRRKLGTVIMQIWARQDISAAWNAVARSPLNATEKQLLFNELWG